MHSLSLFICVMILSRVLRFGVGMFMCVLLVCPVPACSMTFQNVTTFELQIGFEDVSGVAWIDDVELIYPSGELDTSLSFVSLNI